jgi:hypothetical protein
MKTHTTRDSFPRVRNHILDSTPWVREVYRIPAHKAGKIVTMFATLAGVLGVMAAVSYFTR